MDGPVYVKPEAELFGPPQVVLGVPAPKKRAEYDKRHKANMTPEKRARYLEQRREQNKRAKQRREAR